jgi:hypothetical protein
MKKVSVCYLAQGTYWSARHSFESIGFAIKEKEVEFVVKDAPKEYIKTIGDVEVELFVIDHTEDERTSNYFNDIATNVISKKIPLAELYNSVFRMVTGDYVCIIQTGFFLKKDWLVELMYYYTSVDKSGVASIPYDLSKLEMLPLPSSDNENLINVFSNKENTADGVCFFDRQLLYLVGAFDESVSLVGHEISQFCVRCVFSGYFNYYLPTDTCLNMNNDKYIDYNEYAVGKENQRITIAEMKSAKNFYKPL